jgi:hypothetical protein
MSWLNGGKHTIPVARFFGDGVGKYMYSWLGMKLFGILWFRTE